ncbi:MAG TPA: RNA polymerase sporulation sigma factor SigH [Actinomycetota bacterium]|jgi:RNA polymerase sporulation-specific sigma factor|nr:RNA polymerase sporulation sigma factor SigH [Actinomycetota bacterium]
MPAASPRPSSLDISDEDLVERAVTGDDRAIEVLLGRYRHYARAKARSYFLAGGDKEDIVQEGMIGLYKAIRDFQRQHNVAFRAFAELCITRQIISAIKAATRYKHLPLNSYVSLNRTSTSERDDERALVDGFVNISMTDPADLVVSAEEIGAIRASMGRVLSDLETEVLQLYMDGKSYQEIADVLGRHVKSIDNAIQRIKRKLEHHLVRDAGGAVRS